MSYKLTITPKPMYLHAIVTGLNTRETVARYLEEILRECTVRGCFRVLIEERLEGPRLSTIEVFQIASEGSSSGQGQFKAIAYVDANGAGNLMKFAETVAVNRGLPVAVFSSITKAEKWLLGKEHGEAPSQTLRQTRISRAAQPECLENARFPTVFQDERK